MPAKKIKIKYEGEWADAEEVHIDHVNEHQNTYLLGDGTVMNMRTVVVSVARLANRWNDGQPIYVIKSQNVLNVSAPNHLLEDQGDDQANC